MNVGSLAQSVRPSPGSVGICMIQKLQSCGCGNRG